MTSTYYVQGADPALRDREAQRLIDDLVGDEDRSLALEEHAIPGRRRTSNDDEPASTATSDTASLDMPVFTSVTNALQSPPFMTAYRVVVVRDIGNLTADQAKWLATWIETGSDDIRLVLVSGEGRTASSLEKAAKAAGEIVAPANEQTAAVLATALRDAKIKLASETSAHVAAHLGEDAGRVHELVEVLRSTYGSGATLTLDDVDAYLGAVGTAGAFDLTNAIDRGDVAGSLEVLHRLLTATSTRAAKPVHWLQIMGMLARHFQQLVRLDDPSITTKEQAADALGMRSAAGARFRLEAAKRLRTEGLREAIQLLAEAELDLRGFGIPDDRTAMDVLVARLAALNRRHRPTARSRR